MILAANSDCNAMPGKLIVYRCFEGMYYVHLHDRELVEKADKLEASTNIDKLLPPYNTSLPRS
jgi:hypothetical protein